MGNSRSRSASSKETGDDRKGRGATFNGTTKEVAPPTESIEKQLETENTATSQVSLSGASQSLPREPSSDNTQGKRLTASVGVGEEEKSVQSSSKDILSHDGKGRGATFNGTTKEAAPPTESVEKQLNETENTATSQETLRPVDVAVGKESTSQQLGGQTTGDGDEASQSQLCEPVSSDDANKSFSTRTSGGGAADEESYSAPVSTKEANKDGVQLSTGTTQQVSSSTTSVEKQLEVEDIADVTDKESVHALSPLLGDSKTMSGQPKLHINPSTGGKLVSASTGANSDHISHRSNSHQEGSSLCLPTSSSTAQQSVVSAEAANNKHETKVNEVSPGAMRLMISDVRSLSQVDSLQAAMNKSSTDGIKPSLSTDTSTGVVSSEQDMEGSHRSGQ